MKSQENNTSKFIEFSGYLGILAATTFTPTKLEASEAIQNVTNQPQTSSSINVNGTHEVSLSECYFLNHNDKSDLIDFGYHASPEVDRVLELISTNSIYYNHTDLKEIYEKFSTNQSELSSLVMTQCVSLTRMEPHIVERFKESLEDTYGEDVALSILTVTLSNSVHAETLKGALDFSEYYRPHMLPDRDKAILVRSYLLAGSKEKLVEYIKEFDFESSRIYSDVYQSTKIQLIEFGLLADIPAKDLAKLYSDHMESSNNDPYTAINAIGVKLKILPSLISMGFSEMTPEERFYQNIGFIAVTSIFAIGAGYCIWKNRKEL